MEFFRRSPGKPGHLGVLPGTFNPMTIAHLALMRAAAGQVDEVVLVMPRTFPHKTYTGASFEERVDMLCAAVGDDPKCSIATTEGGLFVEIAEECRRAYGERVRISFLCGRDAAERIVGWDYGRPGAVVEMFRQFDLLVAARDGEYHPPTELQDAVRRLHLAREFEQVSASEVRGRISHGEPWEHLVPEAIHERVRKIYQ
ncbi:MAG TPA: adenylyltransferase/cytidyltransferase family protein [Bryobacteraceae bacterium]